MTAYHFLILVALLEILSTNMILAWLHPIRRRRP
jgi:hypothetical protein